MGGSHLPSLRLCVWGWVDRGEWEGTVSFLSKEQRPTEGRVGSKGEKTREEVRVWVSEND